ncbi:MAG TPA: recombinase family protein [Steroidobacteraceae bacterium]|nr:recombinase family protein [Steroidobacteraceae bacterium]
MKVALYARVSKDDASQDPLNQLLPLREFCQQKGWAITREYVDRASAADLRGRVAWRQMLDDAERRRFAILLLWKLDRGFRSTLHAADSLNRLQGYGVALKSLTEEWADGTTPAGTLMRTILIAFAEFEREQIRARTRLGVARARTQGTRLGRRPKLNGEFEVIRQDVLSGVLSQREAARQLRVSPRTIARAVRQNGGHSVPALESANDGFADVPGGKS